MSSNVTITDELIAEIADRMADEGQKISPLAIWSEVHTGSVVAVSAALRKWREARTPRVPQVVERPALPEAVADTMRGALDRLWTSAQDEAERAVARRLAAMRQRVDDASSERDDALAELQSTVQELDALQGQLDQLTRAYEAKVDSAAGSEEDIALAAQRIDAAELRAQELAERVSVLEAELERATSELAAEREARASLEAGIADEDAAASAQAEPVAVDEDRESERAALEAAHSEAVVRLEGELEAIRAALRAEQEAHAAQREEAAGTQAERDAAALDLQNVQAQLASLTDERHVAASEIERLSASLTEAQARAESAEQQADAAQQQIEAAQQQAEAAQQHAEAVQQQIEAAQQQAEAAQQQAAELAERAAASEQAHGADPASSAGVDPQALEALKAQLASEAEMHAAAIAEARENMKKWSDYANGLKQQLTQANEKMIVVLARGAGEASLSRRLAAELGQVNPEHQLLRKDLQQQLVIEAISAQLEQQGYRYDAKTGMVSKVNAENVTA
ncbi:MAG: DNA-binding protein [Paraburkholderia sp.]|uniref:DNA-binding protein n=1 Tax=Paraburkholderia sp. TaxID=1926495 RepID=UPI0012170E56|nr:DNA-binding protein [Paraburkholderia sp.]TAM01386.1 MAG: DNA-binding protein [Paraburkholderia sp.]